MNEATIGSDGLPHGTTKRLRKDLAPGTEFRYLQQDAATFVVEGWAPGRSGKGYTNAFISTKDTCRGSSVTVDVVLWEPPAPSPTAAPTPILTADKAARKEMPIARGVVDYFPRALAEVSHVSFIANEQHNPGEPMHWAKGKSADHADCIVRHLIERGTVDDDKLRHSAKLAWRALALLEEELEAAAKAK